MEYKQNNVLKIVGSVFLGIGLIMSLAGGITLANHISFNKNHPSTNAVIEEIETNTYKSGGKRKTSYKVFVSYEVGEKEYYNNLGYYSSGMHEGDLVKIYYTPENPNNFKGASYIGEIIVIPMGLVYTGLGVVFLSISSKKKKKLKNLLENGIRAEALITEIRTDYSTTLNGRHPVYLMCQITNEVTGTTTSYQSESTFSDLNPFIGKNVTVYANPSNPAEAYVDVKSLVENQIGAEQYQRIEYRK